MQKNIENNEHSQFLRYKERYVIIDPSAFSKKLKSQRTIMAISIPLSIIFSIVVLSVVTFLYLNSKIDYSTTDFIIILSIMILSIFITPIIILKKVSCDFPQKIDIALRIMVSETPIIKFKKDLSKLEKVTIENFSSFLLLYGYTYENKQILLLRIIPGDIKVITAKIKQLCDTMGWNFEEN